MRASAVPRLAIAISLMGLATVLALSGCGGGEGGSSATSAAPSAATAPAAALQPSEYLLGTGDQLEVSVYEQADLTGKYDIDGNGNLVLPLIGPVRARGRTVGAVQAEATERLNSGYLVNPKVNIQVLTYRPFYILGQVNKPGSYPYVVGLTIRQAVALAGGYTARALNASAKITHQGQSKDQATTHLPDDPVLPGDTIEVDRRLF